MSNSLHNPNQNLSRQYVIDGFAAKHAERKAKTAFRRIGAVVLTGALLVGGGAALKNMNPEYQVSNTTFTVVTEQGDTLFSLARMVPGSENVDARVVIEKIEKLNPNTIVNGVVPAYAEITLPASVVEEGEIVDDTAVADNN